MGCQLNRGRKPIPGYNRDLSQLSRKSPPSCFWQGTSLADPQPPPEFLPFQDTFDPASCRLRTGRRLFFSLPFQQKKKCWHKTGRCLRSGCRKVTSRWRVGHPVIFKLLSLLRAQSQITSWCNAAGSSVLVHEEFWSCAQKGGKCEGEIGGYLTRRWH